MLKRLTNNLGEPYLGIAGYPVERGLFDSLLVNTGLISNHQDGLRLCNPTDFEDDPANLKGMWEATDAFLAANAERVVPVTEVFDIWKNAPIGLKAGLHPLFGYLYYRTNLDKIAIYRNGVFQTNFSDADMTFLEQIKKVLDLGGCSRRRFQRISCRFT